MPDKDAPLQWSSTATLPEVREIVRLGEVQMGDILTIALAADQRANTLAYTLATVAAGLLVAGVALVNLNPTPVPAIAAAFASAALLSVSAGYGMVAAKPAVFFARGFRPERLIGERADELQILKWAAEDLTEKIEVNRQAQEATVRLTNVAHRLTLASAVLAPIAALIAWRVG